jgi:hypothetical protein
VFLNEPGPVRFHGGRRAALCAAASRWLRDGSTDASAARSGRRTARSRAPYGGSRPTQRAVRVGARVARPLAASLLPQSPLTRDARARRVSRRHCVLRVLPDGSVLVRSAGLNAVHVLPRGLDSQAARPVRDAQGVVCQEGDTLFLVRHAGKLLFPLHIERSDVRFEFVPQRPTSTAADFSDLTVQSSSRAVGVKRKRELEDGREPAKLVYLAPQAPSPAAAAPAPAPAPATKAQRPLFEGLRIFIDRTGVSPKQMEILSRHAAAQGASVVTAPVRKRGLVIVSCAQTREDLLEQLELPRFHSSWRVHSLDWLTESLRMREALPSDRFCIPPRVRGAQPPSEGREFRALRAAVSEAIRESFRAQAASAAAAPAAVPRPPVAVSAAPACTWLPAAPSAGANGAPLARAQSG